MDDVETGPVYDRTSYASALIVGAGEGISASLARLMAREGLRVALAARNVDKLSELSREIGAPAHAMPASRSRSTICLKRSTRRSEHRMWWSTMPAAAEHAALSSISHEPMWPTRCAWAHSAGSSFRSSPQSKWSRIGTAPSC
jgi:hypothetical protein